MGAAGARLAARASLREPQYNNRVATGFTPTTPTAPSSGTGTKGTHVPNAKS
jgi:hypothetical protein